jgi:hypothetical protein
VQAELDAITERYERPLALACFEQDRRECHRGPDGFAGWYERKTGMAVPELSLLQGLGGGVALVFERARLESSQNRKEARSAQSLPAGETPCKSPGIAHNREKPDNHPPGPGGSYVFYFRYPTH